MKEGHGSPGGPIHSMPRDGGPQERGWAKPRAPPHGRHMLRKNVPNKLCFHDVCSDTLVLKVSSPSLKILNCGRGCKDLGPQTPLGGISPGAPRVEKPAVS